MKSRTKAHSSDSFQLCKFIGNNSQCTMGDHCKFSHDIKEYMAKKGADIGDRCVNFDLFGKCRFGIRCRFAGAHSKEDGEQIVNEEKMANPEPPIKNGIGFDTMKQLRTSKYPLPNSKRILEEQMKEIAKNTAPTTIDKIATESTYQTRDETASSALESVPVDTSVPVNDADDSVTVGDMGPDVPLRLVEKRTLDFSGKTYLAPLTTVGNLPFRRICKRFGVDITCGEMAMATNLLQGQRTEWALTKRHASEDIFGVQVCGNRPDPLIRLAEVIESELDVDFVDINLGCPMEMVYKQGAGSGLMESAGKLGRIVRGMDQVLSCPLTIKFRTGVWDNKSLAHKLVPRFDAWGCALGTLHGRSRQQRYTRRADWNYIKECSGLRNGMQFFGNGDVLSYEEYYNHIEEDKVDGIMIGRGALIKPWLFDEIKTRRHWDISATERLDIMKDFCNYGLEHWGSDTQGVNQTRRFLCEWQSFLHRYIPVGLLEVLPQRINERPPSFKGRNEMETLLASERASDWVKISEMFLGPAPSDFHFIPKHKANAYEVEG
ncbi:hypothetical protein BDF19DRAFT_435174 [Syncephalis fuscata]|nr:hypothetical protein BDF19DRAFT_435174 [Syncephalis fuscata]